MTKKNVPLRARVRYAVDNTLARGVSLVTAWLGLLAIAIVVVAGVLLRVFGIPKEPGGESVGFIEGVWLSLQRTLDAGTGGGDEGWPFRLISLFVTLGGIFIVTALIGLTANGIDRKLEQLRRGRTLVVEQGHTLVLGWSTKLPTILTELATANENQRDAAVVILADVDKLEMDESVRRWLPKGTTTRVVCRTGRPFNANDLKLVRPDTARSVIVLASDDDPGGAYTLKAVLALLSAGVPDSAPLVVEVHDSKRASALKTATAGRVLPVVSSEIIARITAQVCRQSGLSAVYQELLDFDGDEIYFGGGDDRLAGHEFGDVLLAYETSSVIGIRSAEGQVRLAPAMDTLLARGDQVVAVSRDDDTVTFSSVPTDVDPPSRTPADRTPAVEHVLVLGWNEMGPHLIRELDAYAVRGSTVNVVCEESFGDAPRDVACGLLDVSVTHGDTTDEELLARLVAEQWPDHVVVLCYHALPVAEADARTLLSLLELRHVFDQYDRGVPSVVAELLDVDDVALAPVTAADDFVVSEKLTSYVLAQLSENPALAQVFDELLAAGGCEVAIRHAADYVPAGVARYGDVVARFREVGDVVVGYRDRAPDGRAGPVVLNPPKSAWLTVGDLTEVVALHRPETRSVPAKRARRATKPAKPARPAVKRPRAERAGRTG